MDRRWLALGAAALLVTAGAAWWLLQPRTSTAPTFAVTTTGWENGTAVPERTLDLAAARGRVVVLDLMAVECAACRTLTRDVLEPLWHAEAGIELWSIDVWAGLPGQLGETRDDLVRLQQSEGTPWPHALDTDGVYGKYAAYGLPTLVVVDPDGAIALAASAPDLPSLDAVRAAVAAARARDSDASLRVVGSGGLAMAAGVAAVFSPCSVGLLPAYLALLVRGDPAVDGGAATPVRARRDRALRGAAAASAGVVAAYAAIAALLWPFGDALRPLLPYVGVTVAVLLVVLGITMLAGFDWGRLTARVARPDGRRGFAAFGLGYGLASFGCTGPIFLPILFGAFAQGTGAGLLALGLYTGTVLLLLGVAALLVAVGRDRHLGWLVRNARFVHRVVAVAFCVGGVLVLWYDLRALGWV